MCSLCTDLIQLCSPTHSLAFGSLTSLSSFMTHAHFSIFLPHFFTLVHSKQQDVTHCPYNFSFVVPLIIHLAYIIRFLSIVMYLGVTIDGIWDL